jgi:ATP-dependent Clp protease ATP-binding subunit ClpC
MLERFTERARRAVVIATEEARSRGHEAVGPEHLLLGILQAGGGDSPVHCYLEQLGVRPETVRAQVERVLNESPGSAAGGEPTFSPELKAVLESALSVRRTLTVNTSLLLLALLGEDDSAISGILQASGADLAKARHLKKLVSAFHKPVTEEEVSFIATSGWRVRL